MAITNPTSPAVGDPGTAFWADNMAAIATLVINPTVFIATSTAVQSFANTANTPVAFDNESVDIYGGHSNSVNNTRFTVPAALNGYRLNIIGMVQLAANATGAREAWVYKNSVIIPDSFQSGGTNGGGAFPGLAAAHTSAVFATGDIIEIGFVQNSGGALSSISLGCRFEIMFGGIS